MIDKIFQLLKIKKIENPPEEQSLEFVPAGHFYSAISSLEDREAYANSKGGEIEISGININESGQFELLKKFKCSYEECQFPENKVEDFRYYYQNSAYSYTDSIILYSMLREFYPKTVIEIGSGFSSCAMLDVSDKFANGEIKFTFIDPYPELLLSLLNASDNKNSIMVARVQDVDLKIFRSLQENDILFIDSTHVSKLDSDVNTIIFKILPSLNKGVLVHFHDIFWPFDYPKQWIKDGRNWNEAYLLRAFLEYNNNFEIIFFADYMQGKYRSWFQKNMPLCLRNTGGNIWLRKIK
jgi:predicted O-methyltransferase YrrM